MEGSRMTYRQIFAESFFKSFGTELAVATVWVWRGLYFTCGFGLAFGALRKLGLL
jgi:hypothetical protein